VTGTATCGRFVTQSAHGVRSSAAIVAPEGGGQKVPTLGGGCPLDEAKGDKFETGVAG
jgi:hypothetical protein